MTRIRNAAMKRLSCFFALVALMYQAQISATESEIPIRVAEMTSVGSVLVKIPQELKWPSTEKREYKILSGKEYTEVGQYTGILRAKKQMDREERCPDNREHCYIDVSVVALPVNDLTSLLSLKMIKMQIEIYDINDNAPKFANPIIEKMMSEAVDVGTSIRLDSAVDPDYGTNSIQDYQLVSTTGPRSIDKFFNLETITNIDGTKIPKLKLKRPLDRERKGVHEILLEAFDGGTPALTGTATVRINITDSNDNVPKFEKDVYVVDVDEHEKKNTAIIQLVAKDKDVGPNGVILYQFPSVVSAEDKDIFALDSQTGVISVKNSEKLDFEMRRIHHLTVEATDMGPNAVSAYATVTVRVRDVNDNKPDVDVSFMETDKVKETRSDADYDAIIMEDIAVGQYIAFVTITDKDGGDNGTVSCSIPDDGIFSLESIETNTGRFLLKIDRKLDREIKGSFDLGIDAWDQGTPPQNNRRVLKLQVGDINDNAPQFYHDEFEAKVSETASAGKLIMTLQAKDQDETPGPNSNITYKLLRGVDFIMKNGKKYLLTKVFKIDPVSGEVRLAIGHVLDAETVRKPGYLTVLAKDHGKPSLNATTKLKITVIDENDNSPEFKKDNYIFHIDEHSSDGKYIGQVEATDADWSKDTNGKLTYTIERYISDHRSIAPEDESLWLDMFQVDGKTGYIHFYGNRTKLDREVYSDRPITISVVATDNGIPRKRAEATVKIFLTDINDNKPLVLFPDGRRDIAFVQIIPLPAAAEEETAEKGEIVGKAQPHALQSSATPTWSSVVIYEEMNASDIEGFPITLTQVRATDLDEGQNAQLSFTISDGDDNRYFEIDTKDGNVTFAEEVDVGAIYSGCHVLKILVSDLGTPQKSSNAFVNIYISRDGPEVVNVTDAMRDCRRNPLFPRITEHNVSTASLEGYILYIIIGFGVLIFVILFVIVIVLVKRNCCGHRKKSRSYNCQQGTTWNSSSGYDSERKKNLRKRGSSRRSNNGQGTVDSRSSFHSEWTASQNQIPLDKTDKVRVLPDLPSAGSGESPAGHDSGTGDSVSGDAYHAVTYSGSPAVQNPAPVMDGQFMHPHASYSQMMYGSPVNEMPHQMMQYVDLPNMYASTMISPKCTNECLIYGHGDHCWMPDSLLRSPPGQAQGTIDMMPGGNMDRVVYQSHPADTHGLRYHGDPSTPYYYDPGQKFAHLSSNEGSDHLSYVKAHGDDGFHHHGSGDALQPHSSFQPTSIHSPSPHPHQRMYQKESDLERAYINLQGYDAAQNQPEEMHSNLSSASSNTNPYGAALPQNNQRYRNEPNHPQMFYQVPNPANSRYDMLPTTQGYIPGMHDPVHMHYKEDYSASNLLPPATSPDYGQHWDHNMPVTSDQQPLINRPDFNRSGRTSNPDLGEQERLLNQNAEGNKNPGNDGDGSAQKNMSKDEKLSTIDEIDGVVSEVDGLLL